MGQVVKDWLIRTQHRQILGPISKQKLVELVQKGALAPEDEVCSGNGFWFYIKESHLVEKFVFGTAVQDFNKISEAEDVLTSVVLEENGEEDGASDVTKVTKIPANNDLEFPSTPISESEVDTLPDEGIPSEEKKKSKAEMSRTPSIPRVVVKRKQVQTKAETIERNDRFLFYLFFIISFLIIAVLFYYKKVLNKPLPFMSLAHAQNTVMESLSKKKV